MAKTKRRNEIILHNQRNYIYVCVCVCNTLHNILKQQYKENFNKFYFIFNFVL